MIDPERLDSREDSRETLRSPWEGEVETLWVDWEQVGMGPRKIRWGWGVASVVNELKWKREALWGEVKTWHKGKFLESGIAKVAISCEQAVLPVEGLGICTQTHSI